MDFGLSFRFVFKDEAWLNKLITAALYGMIPVIGVMIMGGWGLKVGKQIIDGDVSSKLPHVDFFGDLRRGFLASLIDIIYILPALVTLMVSVFLITAGSRAGGAAQWVMTLLGGFLALIGILLLIVWFFLATVAFANFLAKDRLGAAFNLQALIQLLKNSFSSWLLLILGQVLAVMIIAPMGIIFFGIGILFTTAYAAVVYAHLLGQAYTQATSSSRSG
jgi:hypothetical protein